MKEKHTPLSDYGEFGLIEHLTKSFKNNHKATTKGIGDDAAVIDDNGYQTLFSTDMLIEGVHFDLAYMPLKHLGYKAVIVNLSDIYAMNATPQQISVSIAVSNRFSVEALEELYKGIHQACSFYNVDLVGGDTTSSPTGLCISISAIGIAKAENIIYRNSAKEGDFICVSGDLGAAYLGLQILNREKEVFKANPNMQPNLNEHSYLIGRQLKPEARKDIISYLEKYHIIPTSMIDISDGLSSDLIHICKQSNVGCLIYEANIPISDKAYNQAIEFNMDPITCALNGGEDYELLFTLSPKDEALINLQEIDISFIGTIKNKKEGCQLQTRANHLHKLVAMGWNPMEK